MRLRADTDKRLGQQNKMLNVFKTDLEVCGFGKIRSYCLREGNFSRPVDPLIYPRIHMVVSQYIWALRVNAFCTFAPWFSDPIKTMANLRVWMQVKLVNLENRYNKLSDDLWGEETGAAELLWEECWDNFGRKLENCCRDVHFDSWIGDDLEDTHASISFFPSPHFQHSIFCMTNPQDYAANQA